MEGSGFEFDCCIANLENTKKNSSETPPVQTKILLLFSHPFLRDVIQSVSV
jgi:hypothetical protein